MQIYRGADAPSAEPPGHFGGLAVSDVVRDGGSSALRVQLSYCPPGGGGEMHSHPDDAQLFLLVRGELSFDTGANRFRLGERDAVFFEPGEPHATLNESADDSVAVVVTVNAR